MLGRSANGIFWLFRYLERAENIARLVEAGFPMVPTRHAWDRVDAWASGIGTLGRGEHHMRKFCRGDLVRPGCNK